MVAVIVLGDIQLAVRRDRVHRRHIVAGIADLALAVQPRTGDKVDVCGVQYPLERGLRRAGRHVIVDNVQKITGICADHQAAAHRFFRHLGEIQHGVGLHVAHEQLIIDGVAILRGAQNAAECRRRARRLVRHARRLERHAAVAPCLPQCFHGSILLAQPLAESGNADARIIADNIGVAVHAPPLPFIGRAAGDLEADDVVRIRLLHQIGDDAGEHLAHLFAVKLRGERFLADNTRTELHTFVGVPIQPPLGRRRVDRDHQLGIGICRQRAEHLSVDRLGLDAAVRHPQLAQRFARQDEGNRGVDAAVCQPCHFRRVKLGVALGAAVPQRRFGDAVDKHRGLAVVHLHFALGVHRFLRLRHLQIADLVVDEIVADDGNGVVKLQRIAALCQKQRHGQHKFCLKFLAHRPAVGGRAVRQRNRAGADAACGIALPEIDRKAVGLRELFIDLDRRRDLHRVTGIDRVLREVEHICLQLIVGVFGVVEVDGAPSAAACLGIDLGMRPAAGGHVIIRLHEVLLIRFCPKRVGRGVLADGRAGDKCAVITVEPQRRAVVHLHDAVIQKAVAIDAVIQAHRQHIAALLQIFADVERHRQAPGVAGAGLGVDLLAVDIDIHAVVGGDLQLCRLDRVLEVQLLTEAIIALVVFLALDVVIVQRVDDPAAFPALAFRRFGGLPQLHVLEHHAAVAAGLFQPQPIIDRVDRREVHVNLRQNGGCGQLAQNDRADRTVAPVIALEHQPPLCVVRGLIVCGEAIAVLRLQDLDVGIQRCLVGCRAGQGHAVFHRDGGRALRVGHFPAAGETVGSGRGKVLGIHDIFAFGIVIVFHIVEIHIRLFAADTQH